MEALPKLRIHISVVLLQSSHSDEVHLRSADKARNEEVDRHIVQVLRSIDLLDETVLHNNDSRCHGHSLDLVMRNVDERCTDVSDESW